MFSMWINKKLFKIPLLKNGLPFYSYKMEMDNQRVNILNPQIQIANALFEQIEIMNINNKFRKQKLYKFKQ